MTHNWAIGAAIAYRGDHFDDATYSAGRANIVGLIAGSRPSLVQDSADDHEALHTYSLSGIVMYARNTLLSA